MGDSMVTAIGFLCMGILGCLLAVMTLIKPQWMIRKSDWSRVRTDMEQEYRKRHFIVQLLDAAIFFMDGILAYLHVHITVIILVTVVAAMITTKFYPKKEEYFYESSHK